MARKRLVTGGVAGIVVAVAACARAPTEDAGPPADNPVMREVMRQPPVESLPAVGPAARPAGVYGRGGKLGPQ